MVELLFFSFNQCKVLKLNFRVKSEFNVIPVFFYVVKLVR